MEPIGDRKRLWHWELWSRDEFDHWLLLMDSCLEIFLNTFPDPVREQLDFSPQSLDVLEAALLQRYASSDAMLQRYEAPFVNDAACYIGETFRQALGGEWDLVLDDPYDAYFRLPILRIAVATVPFVDCPLMIATAAAHRRTGSYIRTILERSGAGPDE